MSTFKKHMAAIEADRVEKTNVIGLRKIFNAIDRQRAGYSVGQSSPNATFEEADTLNRAVLDKRPRVAGELHETGLKVLRNPRYAKRWEPWQQKAIDALDHFRLARFDWIGPRGDHCVPVYQVWAKVPPKGDALDGGSYHAFTFRNIPWQSAHYMGEDDGPRVVSD